MHTLKYNVNNCGCVRLCVCTSALHLEADALANVVKMYIFFKTS